MTEPQLTFNWDDVERARSDPRGLFDHPDLARLRALPEGQHFDRKSARVDASGLCKTIVAMANGDPRGGLIAVGFHDKAIEGFRNVGERKINDLLQAPGTHAPAARVHSKSVQAGSESVLLFFIEFSPDKVVELSDGTVYLRVGDSDRPLRPDQVAALRDDRGEVSVERQVVPGSSLQDLDHALLADFASAVRLDLDLQYDRSPEDILLQRRLATQERGRFELRLAGLLALGRDPGIHVPGCRVRFIRYEGTAERTGVELNVVKDTMIEGAVPHLIVRAFEVVTAQLREFRALQPSGSFQLRPEYPPDCVRESIVNACVHRSYSLKNQPIFIRMFDDRLEVESPGGFVAPVTADTIYQFHSPRNPFLMDALRFLRIVRMANEGTRRMLHLMRTSDLPDPQFTDIRGPISKVTVTLKNNIQQRRVWIDRDLSTLIGESLAASLSEEEKRVLNYLAENGRMNVSDAFRITTVRRWQTARRIMSSLVEKGLVQEFKRRPRDSGAYFELKRPGGNGGTHHAK